MNKLPKIIKNESYNSRKSNFLKSLEGTNLTDLLSNQAENIADVIFSHSPYLSSSIVKNPEFFFDIFKNGVNSEFEKIITSVKSYKFSGFEDLNKFLRKEKNKASLLIAIADIVGIWDVLEVTKNITIFADNVVGLATDCLLLDYHNKNIIKLVDVENPQKNSGLVIIALGKMGSFELNYSSDIDLAVYFEDDKLEYLGRKTLPQFWVEFTQQLIDVLQRRDFDGYVFRVDMRLRPDPGAHPVAVSLKTAFNYFNTVGQNWERAAYIKNRFIAGDEDSATHFKRFMDKIIWRRQLDFETIEDIHSIKRQIDTKQGSLPENLFNYNIKLGRGGIREIEFFAQTQQLIWGGRKPSLRKKDTVSALNALVEEGEVEQKIAAALIESYKHYRIVEHRLQMIADEQTHELPTSLETMEEFAIFCGFNNREEFINDLSSKITAVQNYYSNLFNTSPSLASDNPEASGSLVFTGMENDPDTIKTLQKIGFNDPEKISELIRGWHHGRINLTKKKRTRAVLTKLMPALISSFAKSQNPDVAFINLNEFLSKQPLSSQVFSLLYVNSEILDLLAEIFGGYPEIAESLTHHPNLLDYLVSSEFKNEFPEIEYLYSSLEENITHLDEKSLDKIIEATKIWANERRFQVGVKVIRNKISEGEIFENLSNIAEVILRILIPHIKQEINQQYGMVESSKFAIIAYGKFGSRELTFGSDLDLVFVYDVAENAALDLNISPSEYHIRFANKIAGYLTNLTESGKLFNLDLRLRPMGDKGAMACNLQSYSQYYNLSQKDGAWAWEYMALTRARAISEDANFEDGLNKLISEKLQQSWVKEELKKQVIDMHKRVAVNKKTDDVFHVKHIRGGMVDVEYIVQYLLLLNASKNPLILKVKIIDAINALSLQNIIKPDHAKTLLEAFILYRKVQNILRITETKIFSKNTEKILCRYTGFKDFSALKNNLVSFQKKVVELFQIYILEDL
jgi:glutamate-ammonia-ligase adenylyltransferase